jgi:death-on-curing protein
MIEFDSVIEIHETLIKQFGGKSGIRDKNLLISAISRPSSGTKDQEFYPSPPQKAAAIIESIVKNHPFIDGNKRTGYVLMRIVLLEFGFDIKANQDEKYDFVIKIASGQLEYEDIYSWILNHLNK